MGFLSVGVERLCGISLSAKRECGISISVRSIDVINNDAYLRVRPVEVQWVDIDLDADYTVLSNVDWVINGE